MVPWLPTGTQIECYFWVCLTASFLCLQSTSVSHMLPLCIFLSLTLLPSSYNDLCDYIGPIQIIQGNLISRFLTESHFKSLSYCVHRFQGLDVGICGRSHYSLYHILLPLVWTPSHPNMLITCPPWYVGLGSRSSPDPVPAGKDGQAERHAAKSQKGKTTQHQSIKCVCACACVCVCVCVFHSRRRRSPWPHR